MGFELGMEKAERREDGDSVREVGLAAEMKYPPEFLAGKRS